MPVDLTKPFQPNTKHAYYFKSVSYFSAEALRSDAAREGFGTRLSAPAARLKGMDHSISLSQHVNASPEKVWAVISDIPGSAATLSGVESIQMVSEGPYGEGTRWKETRSMMGRRETVEMWVSQADPPRSTTVKALQGGADYTTRFTLEERDGGTDLGLTFGAEVLRPTIVSRLMLAVFGRMGMNLTRKALARDLAEIAAKAEQP